MPDHAGHSAVFVGRFATCHNESFVSHVTRMVEFVPLRRLQVDWRFDVEPRVVMLDQRVTEPPCSLP
jgi:hypothetical protein